MCGVGWAYTPWIRWEGRKVAAVVSMTRVHVRPSRVEGRYVGPGFDLESAYAEHGHALFGFAINALRDRGVAEDCVQETFLRAWRARERFDAERASLRTWLFVIARNVIVDQVRSRARQPRVAPDDDLELVADAQPDTIERLRLHEALAKLGEAQREAVVSIHLIGVSYAELSEATGVPVATLRTRTFYGLRALRDDLDDQEN